MALSLRDIRYDPIANRALEELMRDYTVAEEESRLVLTKKTGAMKLFLYDLDEVHQWEFIQHRETVKELEQLRARLATLQQQLAKELEQFGARSATLQEQRESWKQRALKAEVQLLEATAKASRDVRAQNVSDVRYASLKRFLAKRFHPDYAPGQGIEKIVRNEIFKEIWSEVERLNHAAAGRRSGAARSSAAA